MQPRARSARKRFTRRSSREWNEIPAKRPPSRSSGPGQRQRRVDLVELVVDRDAQRLEDALGGVTGGEACGYGDRVGDHVDELRGRLDRLTRALAHDRARDLARVALLAVLAQDAREAALVPGRDELGGALPGRWDPCACRAARRRRTRSRARRRRSASRRCRDPCSTTSAWTSSAHELLERLRERRGDEARAARRVGGEALEAARAASGSRSIAISRPVGAESLGDEARVPAGAERRVDRRLAGLRVEQLEQLRGEDGDVLGGHRHGHHRCPRRSVRSGIEVSSAALFAVQASRSQISRHSPAPATRDLLGDARVAAISVSGSITRPALSSSVRNEFDVK